MANNLIAFDATQFSAKVVERLNQTNVMLGLTNRDWEGDLSKGLGSTVRVRTVGNVTLFDYNKGDTINYQDLAPATESFTVNHAKGFAFKVDDIDKAQNDIDALDAYAERARVALNDSVEARIMETAQGRVATANKITGASNAPIAIDATNVYANFVKASEILDRNNVPHTGRWAVVDPATKSAVAQSPDLIRSTQLGDRMVQGIGGENNYIGKIADFDVYWSNAVITDANAKYALFGDMGAIAYAAQLEEVEMLRLEVTFATALRGLLLHEAFVADESSKRLASLKIAK